MQVVLDTNVLVSGLAYPQSNPGRIVDLWRRGRLDVILSRYILEETIRVLPRLTKVNPSADELLDFVDGLVLLADFVEPDPTQDPELRDASDHPVLGTLVAARANYLITGDKDLLALSGRYSILTPAAFLKLLGC